MDTSKDGENPKTVVKLEDCDYKEKEEIEKLHLVCLRDLIGYQEYDMLLKNCLHK